MPKRSFEDPNEPIVSKRQFAIVLRSLYPRTTTNQRGHLLKRFGRKQYRGRLLTVAATVVDNWVRHNMTLYERLLYASDDPDARSMARKTARQAVAGQVAAIIASWEEGSALEDPTFRATRNDLHQRRLREGPSVALTQAENIAIVEALTQWLQRRGEAVRGVPVPKDQVRASAEPDENIEVLEGRAAPHP